MIEHTYTAAFESLNVKNIQRFRALLKLAYRAVDRVVAVSEGQKRWIVEAGFAPSDSVLAIPCILDLSPFRALPAPTPHAGPMRLGALGRFSRQKGFDTLIEAMREVPRDVAQLTLAGYGEDEASLRASARDFAQVSVIGRVDPVAFISAVDAIVMPSRWEAGAVTCWELRAAARPAVVTDVDGLPEQISADRGLVVPPDKPAQLAQAIRRLAAMDRRQMSESARRSTDGAFDRTLTKWRRLLGGSASDPVFAEAVPEPTATFTRSREKVA